MILRHRGTVYGAPPAQCYLKMHVLRVEVVELATAWCPAPPPHHHQKYQWALELSPDHQLFPDHQLSPDYQPVAVLQDEAVDRVFVA